MKHILVVATAPVEPERVRARVVEHAGEDVDIHVVAPASDLSPLQWLASDEDKARAEAAEVAEEVESAVEPEAEHVEAEVGDPDPVQAIEDALRTYPADEIVLVTHEDDHAGWLEEHAGEEAVERFGVPITRLAVD